MSAGDEDRAEPGHLLVIGINRRQLIVRLAGAAGGAALPGWSHAQDAATTDQRPKGSRDPMNPVALWPKLLSKEELATAAALADVILPADDKSPAPSTLAVHDFVDEWVSAPYPRQLDDRVVIRGGLAWLNSVAVQRFGARFVDITPTQKTAICDDIAADPPAPKFAAGARFFKRMRHLTMLGFYTTPEGMKDLGYVGNVALPEWKGPSDELLRRLGLL